jgi:hypothetical protein
MTDTDRELIADDAGPPARVNCALVPRAAAALARIETATSYNKTDVVNRAIQVYDFLLPYLDEPSAIFLSADGSSDGLKQLVLL